MTLWCKMCRQIVLDVREGICFECAELAQEEMERLNRLEETYMTYDVEEISATVHEQWMKSKLEKGITSRRSENGEELMVPYDQLSEAAKDLDRGSVKAVLAAIQEIQVR